MTVHLLTAGDGYEYLTRQVASADAGRAGRDLSAYYAESGYPPGRWLGRGLAGLAGGQGVSGAVETEQMKRLFGTGCDLVTGEPLGHRFRVPAPLAERVARRVADLPEGLSAAVREQRIAGIHAEERARRVARPVAGFDCVFTPAKSVSVLWALGDQDVQAAVLAAHHGAVAQTLDYMQREVVRTRVGPAGIAQVDTRGLIAAAFDHWDARPVRDSNGAHTDPNLHTHVVIANRVQGPDGRWRTVDSRALHQAVVACSERYNVLVADELVRRLGVRFADRQVRRGRQPVREVEGISATLIGEFSSRRAQVQANLHRLIGVFRAEHGREPTTVEQIRLAQTATLSGRQPKAADHPPLAVQLRLWRQRAAAAEGRSPHAVVAAAVGRRVVLLAAADVPTWQLDRLAASVRAAVAARRATWNRWHVQAEASRQTAHLPMADPAARDALIAAVTGRVLAGSIALQPAARIRIPAVLRRADGESVFARHNAARYTGGEILAAEGRLLAAARSLGGPSVDPWLAAAVAARFETVGGRRLSDDQAAVVQQVATSGRAVEVLIGPAGTGKTTTMRALAAAWQAEHGPGSVLLLAPSAAAARVLSDAVRERGDNLAKWLYETSGPGGRRRRDRLTTGRPTAALRAEDARWRLAAGQLVIVDEAALAGTLALDELRGQAARAGAKLLLVGDYAQLPAVEAGGALRLLAHDAGAAELHTVWRFANRWEAAASLRLRDGDPSALDG